MSINTDEDFQGIAFAIDNQTAFGAINTDIRDLSGALDLNDGIILGDKNSGDGETGITLPNLSSLVQELPQIASSFTQDNDAFIRSVTEGLEIAFPLKGNGQGSGAPDVGNALPDNGIDRLLRSAGLAGANGAAPPDYIYTPRATTEYTTIKIWVADLSFVFMDCVVETLKWDFVPGGNALTTASIRVGSINTFADGVTFPTFTWGNQESLVSPVVEGMTFNTFGQERGFESLTITIQNNLVEFGDSNVATVGVRLGQVDRLITVDGRFYLETTQSSEEYDALILSVPPTDDLTMQLGTPESGGGSEEINAVRFQCSNLQMKDFKYDRTGTAAVAEITGAKCTAQTAGGEFEIEFN